MKRIAGNASELPKTGRRGLSIKSWSGN